MLGSGRPFYPEILPNPLGDLVRVLGHDLTWDQKDDAGHQVHPGDYHVRMLDTKLGEGIVASLVGSPVLAVRQ